MQLVHLPINNVWVFLFGGVETGTPTRLDNEPLFFRFRRDAVGAASRHGLKVDRDGKVAVEA